MKRFAATTTFVVGVLFVVALSCGQLTRAKIAENDGELQKHHDETKIGEEYEAKEVIGKNPRQLLRIRGFQSENHFFRTIDGYFVNLVRVINPFVNRAHLKRPVLFNHGLFESATIWLINARNAKAKPWSPKCNKNRYPIKDHSDEYDPTLKNAPMLLANKGYDVWLMSMRGTSFSRRHALLNDTDNEFWDYSLDDFGLKDVPGAINYIRRRTGAKKVGYVGHSQATFSVFALLSTRPRYSQVIEPVVAVAPVSYFDHITSVLRQTLLAALHSRDQNFNGPFPPDADEVREGLGELCKASNRKHEIEFICDFTEELISGPSGKGWLSGYFSQVPFATSQKVMRHFGQIIRDRRFQRYDYGPVKNTLVYGQSKPPEYPVERIDSQSLCLFYSKQDTIAAPTDVERFKNRLTVPLLKDVFIETEKINHFDLITHEDGSDIVNHNLLEVLEELEYSSGYNKCRKQHFHEPQNISRHRSPQ